MDDCEEEPVCPLCLEELDLTDRHFKPCQCGYQVCLPASHLWSLCWSRGSVSGIDRCKPLHGRLILDTNLFVCCHESISAAQWRYADGTVHVLAKLKNEPKCQTGLLCVMFELQLGPRLRTVVVQRVCLYVISLLHLSVLFLHSLLYLHQYSLAGSCIHWNPPRTASVRLRLVSVCQALDSGVSLLGNVKRI